MDRKVPDPIEQMEQRIDRLADRYVDEHTCMGCGKTVDYQLLSPSPIGDGPALCLQCLGLED